MNTTGRTTKRFTVLGQPANMFDTYVSVWLVRDRTTSETVAGPFSNEQVAIDVAKQLNRKPLVGNTKA